MNDFYYHCNRTTKYEPVMKKTIVALLLLPVALTAASQDMGRRKTLWNDRSTRGFEFTVKGIISPAGGWVINRSHYNPAIPPMEDGHYGFAYGGGVLFSYRINKCMSIGLGLNVVGATEHFSYSNLPYGNIKLNVYDGGRFLPYVSVDAGYDVWHTLVQGFSYEYDPNNELGYYYNPGIVMGPAVGMDFPMKKRGSVFVELRTDFVIGTGDEPISNVCPGIGFGYTF